MNSGLKIIAFCLLILSVSCLPKVLWVYWNSGLENAPKFVRLSILSSLEMAKSKGWETNFVQ